MSSSTQRLWTGDAFVADPWRHLAEDDGHGSVILPLSSWQALSAQQRIAGANRLGVLLQPDDRLETIIPELSNLALVALAFPAYTDGRSHSKATLLKSRYHFQGEVRAVGDILVDQIPLMLRNGFDTLEVNNKVAIQRLEQGKSSAVDIFYQPASKPSNTTQTFSWRRLPKT